MSDLASAGGEWSDPRVLLGGFGRDFYYPRYRDVSGQRWRVRTVMMVAARGYWGQVYPIDGTVILTGPSADGPQSWMSMSPSEIESQEIGLRASFGHTVVLGFGMGWLAANVALRDQVERLTIVERDPDVIALAGDVLAQLPAAVRAKITLVEGDALSWRAGGRVDLLQADIWYRYVEDQKLDDVRRMQANVQAGSIYFWGQEMEIWRHACRRADSSAPSLDWTLLHRIVEDDLRLPVVLPDWPDYPERIIAAAAWWAPRNEGWWRAPVYVTPLR